MRNHEFVDPSIPQIQRRGHRLMQGVRCYKVAEVDEIEANGRIGFKQTLRFATDGGQMGVYKPLVIRARSKEAVQVIRGKVEFVAEREAIAHRQYKEHDINHAEANREFAVRIRSELEEKYKIKLPKREWNYDRTHGLMDSTQTRMF